MDRPEGWKRFNNKWLNTVRFKEAAEDEIYAAFLIAEMAEALDFYASRGPSKIRVIDDESDLIIDEGQVAKNALKSFQEWR